MAIPARICVAVVVVRFEVLFEQSKQGLCTPTGRGQWVIFRLQLLIHKVFKTVPCPFQIVLPVSEKTMRNTQLKMLVSPNRENHPRQRGNGSRPIFLLGTD